MNISIVFIDNELDATYMVKIIFYSPKLDFKIVFCSNNIVLTGEEYIKAKEIFFNLAKPETKEQFLFAERLRLYNKLKSSNCDKESITSIFKEENVNCNSNILFSFLSKLEDIKDINSKTIFIIRKVLTKNIFGGNSFMITSFLINSILIKNNHYPIVLTYDILLSIRQEILLLNIQDDEITEKLKELEQDSIFYSKEYEPITKEEIIKTILDNKNSLVSKGIVSVRLYGSFYLGNSNTYSDIDLMVEITESLSNELASVFHRCQFCFS